MEKYGVVKGVVKTASADNDGDPVGVAAKCIAAAKSAVIKAEEVRKGLKGGVKDAVESDGEGK